MEITLPLPIAAYGYDVRDSLNLYLYIDRQYCFKPFEYCHWFIMNNSNRNVFELILSCCDDCNISLPDDLSPVHHMEDRVHTLYTQVIRIYESMEDATNAKRLENNPNDIMEKDIDIVAKCLQCWIIAYDDIQRRWNTDDMIKYFYEPNKVLFLFKKEKYYSMYPKEVTKKYKKVISALPPTHGKVIFDQYPRYYEQRKLWTKLVKEYFLPVFHPNQWIMHKVKTGPNSVLEAFILYTELLQRPLMTSPAEEFSLKEKIKYYRDVIAHHYEFMDKLKDAERIRDAKEEVLFHDMHLLCNKSHLWGFVRYENRGIRLDTGYWDYFQRQYYNVQPIGLFFVLSLNDNEYALIIPKQRKEEFSHLILKHLESNFQLEKKKTNDKPKSSEKPKKRCPKGTMRDKKTGECVEKKKKDTQPKKKDTEPKKKDTEPKKKDTEPKKKDTEPKETLDPQTHPRKKKTSYEKIMAIRKEFGKPKEKDEKKEKKKKEKTKYEKLKKILNKKRK